MFNLDEIYTVSDFLSLCNKTVENHIPTCWLQGEISNLSRPASGHWYFSLKDNRGQIRCALFRLNQRNIKFTPEDGMEVLLRAAPTIYQARGDFQLIIQHVEPVGVGNLQLAFDQLKAKLKQAGLFDSTHKKPIPTQAQTIGVISSSTGAVIQDIIKVLAKRYPFSKVLLFDTTVQGEGSAQSIVQALNAADQSNQCDVLMIARGGGSLEDLWAFNEEILARAIFEAKTPIISAIGHETDTTIADFVADRRAPTPSAAAVMASPDRLELIDQTKKYHSQLTQTTRHIINSYQAKLQQLSISKPNLERQLVFLAQRLDDLNARLNSLVKLSLHAKQAQVSHYFEQLKQFSPNAQISQNTQLNQLAQIQLRQNIDQIINQYKNHIQTIEQRLKTSINQTLQSQKNQVNQCVMGLEHLSPLATLSRGYSISKNSNNQVLRQSSALKIGETMITLLHDGTITSKVTRVKKT